ncbi:uncharacterized protein LOC135431778 isoform X19 [Drosophila montana]|uniref:uncharacterized protein LOC135431778 isoform X19 n=1 Tax=Drosophila montana TaxID=40370 RepID=UPI00313EF3F4
MWGALIIGMVFIYCLGLAMLVRRKSVWRSVRDYLDCQMLLSSRRQWQQPAKSPK